MPESHLADLGTFSVSFRHLIDAPPARPPCLAKSFDRLTRTASSLGRESLQRHQALVATSMSTTAHPRPTGFRFSRRTKRSVRSTAALTCCRATRLAALASRAASSAAAVVRHARGPADFLALARARETFGGGAGRFDRPFSTSELTVISTTGGAKRRGGARRRAPTTLPSA
jgi:hypothetical protein